MNQHDMHVFLEVGVNFFEKTTGEKAIFGNAALQFGKCELLDYSGVIRVSGSSEGAVCLTMPCAMLGELLRAAGESEPAEDLERDMAGEAASVIASNARKHFGPRFAIAPPEIFGLNEARQLSLPFARFVMPMQWRGHRANLILALSESTSTISPSSPPEPCLA
jgi:CheY-specific phosphatase CheX